MSKLRRGIFVSLAERYVLIVASLGSSMLLARFLTPEEIGVYSVSLALIGIAQVIRDFGIGNFLIQEKSLSDAHLRSALGVSLVIGILLFVLVYFLAPVVAAFYGDIRLVDTIRLSGLNFVVLPFSTVSLALLRRDMLFKRLALLNIATTCAGLVVGVWLAYAGYGPNSLAYAALVTNGLTGLFSWLVRPTRELIFPGFMEWKAILRFGSHSSLSSIVTTISMDVNDLAVGKILGMAPVAMISRAQGVVNIFHRDVMASIRGVMFPAFANAHRQNESVDALHTKSVIMVTGFAWPFYGFASINANELMLLLFGPQWGEAADLVPLFCAAGAVSAVAALVLNSVVAVGRVDLAAKADLLVQPVKVILIVLSALEFQTLFACAAANLVASVIAVPVFYVLKQLCLPTNFSILSCGLIVSAKLSVVTLLLPVVFAQYSDTISSALTPLGYVAFVSVIALISWVYAARLLSHPVCMDPMFMRVTSYLPASGRIKRMFLL